MWKDKDTLPTKYISLFMLLIYICVGMFLLFKLRSFDPSIFKKIISSTADKAMEIKSGNELESNEPKGSISTIEQSYVDKLTGEPGLIAKQSTIETEGESRSNHINSVSELLKLDGRLCMAQAIEPYFARR